jgi:putative heme-binding domain-containing protein
MRPAVLSVSAVAFFLSAALCLSFDPPPKDPNIADTEHRTPAEELKAFHLPPGFEAQLVAAEPDIHKPLNMAFDDRGRLWVSETVEYPFPKDPTNPNGPLLGKDAVKILEDFGDDGKARTITTFADKLDIPIGVLPLNNPKPQEVIVYSIPHILKLRDDGTGKAGERTELYATFGFRDTHGMTSEFTWGFDGWVYACHGFSNESKVQGADKSAIKMQSGNTYRFKTDGSHVEQFTHGQVNPFGLAFDARGNLYSCDCHTKPIMLLLRGAYYDSFGMPHDGLGYAPDAIDRYDDSTAIAGIAFYDADHFPKEYRDSAYIGDVVTNCINEFRLTWHGSSPQATKREFLRSDDPWFRPVCIKLGPDGALYVADFYNRIIGHYEVPLNHPGRDRESGRIWRIVYRGADGKAPSPAFPKTDWTAATVAELMKDLGNPNLAIRFKATNELAERGGKEGIAAVKAVLRADVKPPTAGDDQRRMHGLWVLERQGALDDEFLKEAATDREAGVRIHCQRILAERKEQTKEQRELVLAGLKDDDATVRRCAADGLGRHPTMENIRPLLDLRRVAPADDVQLVHTVRMALRDQLTPAGYAKLPLDPWTDRDAGYIADVSLGARGPEAAAFLLKHVQKNSNDHAFLFNAVRHIARNGSEESVKSLLGFAEALHPEDLGLQVGLYRAMDQGTQERGDKLGDAARGWASELTGKLLASKQPADLKAGAELVGALRLEARQARILELAGDRATPDEARVAALRTLRDLDARRHAPVLGRTLGDAETKVELREQAANLLAEANQPETQAELLSALPTAPARLQNVIAAGLSNSREGGEKLLAAVEAGKASPRLLQEVVVVLHLNDHKVPDVKERLEKLTKGLKPADQAIQELIAARRAGFLKAAPDADKGAPFFEKSCAICHQLGGKGAKVGPQLDGVGLRGLDRLLEDVLDPNRNVDQAFRLTQIVTKKGVSISGLLLKEEGEVLVLADAQGKEVRVRKDEVDERTTSQLSPMPGDFAEKVTEAEFYHLMAFLLKQRVPPGDKPKGE